MFLSMAFLFFELLCQRQKADTLMYLCFLPFSFAQNIQERFDKHELIRN